MSERNIGDIQLFCTLRPLLLAFPGICEWWSERLLKCMGTIYGGQLLMLWTRSLGWKPNQLLMMEEAS